MNIPLQKIATRIIGLFFFLLMITLTGCDKSELIHPDNHNPTSIFDGPAPTETQDITEHIMVESTLLDIHDDPNMVDYRVTLSSWEIKAALHIEAGVVFEFLKDAEVRVREHAVLDGNFSGQKQIRFTCVDKTAGSWVGIIGHPRSRISLSNTIVEYAGGSLLGPDSTASAIQVDGDLILIDSEVKNSNGYGLRTSSRARLFYVYDNIFTDNAKAAISTTADQLHAIRTHLEFARNGHNGVQVRSSTLENDLCPTPWETLTYDGSASYLIENEDPTIPAELLITTNLELEPGVTIEFGEGAGLRLSTDGGMITAIGTSSEPITFKGKKEEKGFWKGIFLEQSKETSQLEHVVIKDGGSEAFDDQLLPYRGNIGVHEAKLNISNSSLMNSNGCALATHQTQGEDALIEQTNNVFTNNNGGQFCGI